MSPLPIGKALHAKLSGSTNVTSTLAGSSSIYPHRLPQGEPLPAISYSMISAPKVSAMGTDHDSRPRFQVSCWAKSHAAAVTAAEAVKGDLQRMGTETVTVGSTSVTIKEGMVVSELDTFDDETESEGRIVDFRFTHGE